MTDDELTGAILGAAIAVHRELGPGMLESAYEACLAAELRARGLQVEQQVPISLLWRGTALDIAFRLDLRVAGRVIVEVKAIKHVRPVHTAQVLTYLRWTGLTIGLLLNFNQSLMMDGVHRIVRNHPS